MHSRVRIYSVLFAHLLTATDLTEKASANDYCQHTFLFVLQTPTLVTVI